MRATDVASSQGVVILLSIAPFAFAPYSGDDAIAHVRDRMRNRGYAAEVTAGPMLAL